MASTDARPVPIKNTAFRAVFPLYDADGDLVTGASSLDSEVSKDQGTFADCTNEATEIATSSGMYYLDLTNTEMNADCVAVIVKSASAKTTVLVFYPNEAGDIDVDVTAFGGTAGTFSSGRPEVNASHLGGTSQTGRDVGASVLLSSGTGTGQVSFTSGILAVNTTQLGGSATPVTNLAGAATGIVLGSVDTAGFSPTTTEFETSLTEATADHYNGRLVVFRSGALAGQQTLISDYALASGRGHITCVAMTEAPGNGDTFAIV